ncbi:Ribosomal RNA large subunit methyltransferase K/L [Caloramator mitchellensis]|uniref:Ribosomal RNA large subunit methyltransferase K/L n=1 Tax=Caloramator mitchellensis TaxID=908809 RepID=A0A0R3JUY8_CALMK|nr:class I SAM-dependent RNA methyltransferase [Caloramator mitchellensis]KRQ87383.1 Ribosomal RNA large subunit methyltransferase K/L [Caloramator mitchellensis]
MKYNIIVTCAFGIEGILADEIRKLGYEDLRVENGKVEFEGDERAVVRCNLWLRCADRVLIKIKEFEALTFEDLFQGTKSIRWGDILPKDAFIHVVGKSVKSQLFSVSDCQAIVKKAIIESMKNKYKIEWFEENGPTYKIEISLLKDIATLTLDTSGLGLHKRGYRELAGEAPLKETLASALIYISRWTPDRILADPFCGSGTIIIEAALMGKNIAPGLNREFAAEKWSGSNADLWRREREIAKESINDKEFLLLGSDIDGKVLKVARENAKKAGVENLVAFQKLSMDEFRSKKKYGVIITNPPYGERLMEKREVEKLYKKMGEVFSELETWSFFILTAHPEFQRHFGKRADRNRKLYNGKLLCYYYQYFGPLPPKR